MKHHTRRAIAYIAGSLITNSKKNSIFDYSNSSYNNFSNSSSGKNVAVFDYVQGCHISGNLPTIFHYGDNHHISLNLEGNKFKGFDYGESCHFSGSVNGNQIQIFDYGESAYFNYSL